MSIEIVSGILLPMLGIIFRKSIVLLWLVFSFVVALTPSPVFAGGGTYSLNVSGGQSVAGNQIEIVITVTDNTKPEPYPLVVGEEFEIVGHKESAGEGCETYQKKTDSNGQIKGKCFSDQSGVFAFHIDSITRGDLPDSGSIELIFQLDAKPSPSVVPSPTPTPSPSARPTASPTPSSSPRPSATAFVKPSPKASPSPVVSPSPLAVAPTSPQPTTLPSSTPEPTSEQPSTTSKNNWFNQPFVAFGLLLALGITTIVGSYFGYEWYQKKKKSGSRFQ